MKEIYNILYKHYGKQGWWPLSKGDVYSKHHNGGPEDDRDRFEIVVGAVLTQNTNWKNVERALKNLIENNLLEPRKIIKFNKKKLANLIRPSGYYNQKAERLRIVAKFFLNNKDPGREELLKLKGIGKETADSILLYAYKKPYFVIDAYTKRIMNRLGFKEDDYDGLQGLFYRSLKKEYRLFNEFHALLVEHAKRYCKQIPECDKCCLKKRCKFKLNLL